MSEVSEVRYKVGLEGLLYGVKLPTWALVVPILSPCGEHLGMGMGRSWWELRQNQYKIQRK